MKASLAILLGLSMALAMARRAESCSCFGDTPIEQLFNNADAVFRGAPTSYTEVGDDFVYTFAVTACWKGDVGKVIELRALISEAACGVFIPTGYDVIVYANYDAGNLRTNLCLLTYGTNPVHLDWLGEPTCTSVSVDEYSWGRVKALYR